MNSHKNNITCDNHIIKWKYKITCEKIAEKIIKSDIVAITPNKIAIQSLYDSFTEIDQNKIKKPDFIKHKIKNVYRNKRGMILFIYEDCTVYLKCGEEMVGKLY